MITTRDFIDWKANPVTKAVMDDLSERVILTGEELSYEAGIEPLRDRFKAGYAQALRDLLAIKADEVVEVESND